MAYHERSVFLTLTYSDENLPEDLSISKRHLQLFLKRLRKQSGRKGIKYFGTGEYGEYSQRPHYHAIVFGVGLQDEDKQLVKDCWPLCDWNVKSIAKNAFGLVEPESIDYVCRYIDKKVNGEMEDVIYGQTGRCAPFRLVSNGLGLRYAMANHTQIAELMYISRFGKKTSIPRYYLKKLEIDSEALSHNAKYAEAEKIEKVTGINISSKDLLSSLDSKNIDIYYKSLIKDRKSRLADTTARTNLRKRKL